MPLNLANNASNLGVSNLPHALLVEDSAVNRMLMDRLLKAEGFEVAVAINGLEAVEAYKGQSFDLVLMDIQMPIMDGLEATRQIRELEKQTGHHTPIVAVTAGMDRDSCLNAGMDAYLEKPVYGPEIHEVLNQVCPHLI